MNMVEMAECWIGVLRLPPYYLLGLFNRPRSLKIICKLCTSQAQASDAGNLRSMIVGLGNHSLPDTRHSVGMLVVDCLAKYLGISWHFNKQSLGYVAVTKVGNQKLILLKPSVAMNLNGRSISKAVAMFNVNPSDVILVHDDLDRPLGKYSLKHGGSAGGHNGVKSAIASLHSDSLRRVRVGIGRPSKRNNVTEYVLSNFDPSEIPVMERTIEQCCEVLMKEFQLLRS